MPVDDYELPRSQHMLSHLTSGGAVKEHKQKNARKLIREQEEHLRRLSNIRRGMESTEHEIGKVNDYYRGGHHGEKYSHVLGTAAKRSKDRVDKRDKMMDEITRKDRYDYEVEREVSPRRVHYNDEGFESGKFDEEIGRLKRKIIDISLRGKDYNTYGSEMAAVPGLGNATCLSNHVLLRQLDNPQAPVSMCNNCLYKSILQV